MNGETWQWVVVWSAVMLAGVSVGRRIWLTLRPGSRPGCHDCDHNCGDQAAVGPPVVALDLQRPADRRETSHRAIP
jgi:hypothetical protein